jgi:CheY-like chemotaxis protein
MIPKEWTVLIVDDEEDMRQILKVLLEVTYGCTVVEAASQEQVVAVVQNEAPDLIFLDLKLGMRSGEDIARALRAMPATTEVPIVVISEHCWSYPRRQAALAAGCDYCLDKAELFPDFRASIDKAMKGLPPEKIPVGRSQ